jgi:SAM-dependent methyltransferase
MVHALNEIRRVLAPGGVLVDLRPMLDQWPLEVSWRDGYREAGRSTDLKEPRQDDAAANAAMSHAASTGHLRHERQEVFPLFHYWDTPKEMEEHIAEEWDDVIRVEEPVWAELRRSWASANAEARVRLRMKMSITRYQKT